MRWKSRCFLIFLIAAIGLLVYWLVFKKESHFVQTCNQTQQFQNQLHHIVNSVHKVLENLNLRHFLCYESLWGQLRLGRTLPWAEKAEICIFNEEISGYDEVYLARSFMKSGLMLEYEWSDGVYHVNKLTGLATPYVVLIVFEKDPVVDMYRRVGLKRRLLPPNCEGLSVLSCFPPSLAVKPLPMKEFGGYMVPVPREHFEIQKYHYPDTWWKETVPKKNC